MPVASAAAEPPLEPPAVSARFQGLRVAPNTEFTVFGPNANSGVGLADHDRAGIPEPLDNQGVLVGHVAFEELGAEGRADALRLRHVLDADRHAEEGRQRRATAERSRGSPRFT
jgi:hypothetical protein